MDHDRLFKELLTTFFADFIDLFFPEVMQYLDRDSIAFMDKEIFTDVTSGERHEVDVLARAKFKGSEAFFLVHVETQASPDTDFARRMFKYFARLHEKHNLPVYPIVLFSYVSPQRAEPEEYCLTFPDLDVLTFRYRVIQLNRLNWRDYVRRPNPVATALMARMRIALEDRARVKLECLRILATLRLNPAKLRIVGGFMDSYLKLTAAEAKVFKASIEQVPSPSKEQFMEIMTGWGEMAQQKLVLRQMTKRFGKLPTDLHETIDVLPWPAIEELGEAILDFKNLEDVREWLRTHPVPS